MQLKHLLFICGSRDYPHTAAIQREIQKRQPDLVMNGAGGDTDTFATKYAHEDSIHAIEVPAMWDRLGKAAGPQRNFEMAQIIQVFFNAGWGVSALAFSVTDPPRTPGTADMIKKLRRVGIEAEVITQ